MFHSHPAREIKEWKWNMPQSSLTAEWFQTGSSVVFASSDTDTAIIGHPETCLH